MQKTSYEGMQCPIARSLERVGEWWSMLILRETLFGFTRFYELEENLGIAPNMLSRRLNALVEAGMLEKCAYTTRPIRYEYKPTDRARDFADVLLALLSFGNRHFAPEGKSVTVIHDETGIEAVPVMVDARTGIPLASPAYRWVAGPLASQSTRERYATDRRLGSSGLA
ncbi:winged helix-turn-helix transcriptional regulator [Castellaniella sp.]|uniref:winged helix-turn-helix transcriptional regulator n=1 Tax=Castellaniella sp. TaxID=1955812 RepID=UPI003C713F50